MSDGSFLDFIKLFIAFFLHCTVELCDTIICVIFFEVSREGDFQSNFELK